MHKQQLFKLMLISTALFFNYLEAEDHGLDSHELLVTGEATLYKPADQVVINLGVVTEDAVATISLSNNNSTMQEIIKAITSIGLDKGEYQTGHFTIEPIYSTPPQNPNPNWRAKITGYRVTNLVKVQTSKLEMIGKLIDAAGRAGANSIGDIAFNLSDHQKYRAEAIKAAATNAIDDAKSLADAAQLKLDKVLRIELDPVIPPQPLYKSNYGVRSASFDSGTPIESGDVEVKAKVAVIYQIKN